jgi:3-hydroxyacyl-[acyl-carrier protein] dehydratase/trans-2-decenoyl-[acyl-carrier protein] isomerase
MRRLHLENTWAKSAAIQIVCLPLREDFALANPRDFHVPKDHYTKADLLQSSLGGYFGPGNAQLPAPPMLMMDRITEISLDGGDFGKGHVVAELDISADLWFFDCHFIGDPVMPGCLGLDAMWQVIGYWLGWSGSPGKGRAIGVGEVKFRGDITPITKVVRYEVSLRQVRRGKLALGLANGRLFADDVCVYTANDLKVGMIESKTEPT